MSLRLHRPPAEMAAYLEGLIVHHDRAASRASTDEARALAEDGAWDTQKTAEIFRRYASRPTPTPSMETNNA